MTRPATPPALLSAAAEVAAERYGMPMIDADRSRLIAALHALINWLIDHPGIPVPGRVQLAFNPVVQGGVVDAQRLIELAQQLDGRVDAAGRNQWMQTSVCTTGEHGAEIEYVVFAGDFDSTRRRFTL